MIWQDEAGRLAGIPNWQAYAWLILAILLGMAGAGMMATGVERVAYRPLRGAPRLVAGPVYRVRVHRDWVRKANDIHNDLAAYWGREGENDTPVLTALVDLLRLRDDIHSYCQRLDQHAAGAFRRLNSRRADSKGGGDS